MDPHKRSATIEVMTGDETVVGRPDPPLDEPVPREHARDVVWVQPVLVGEVAYRTMTPDRRLRHPSWRGLRPDRTPDEDHLEEL